MSDKAFGDFSEDDEISALLGWTEYTDEDGEKVAIDAIEGLMEVDHEFRSQNDIPNEYATFLVLTRGFAKASTQDQSDSKTKFIEFFFKHWVFNSPNSYAVAYRQGRDHAVAEITTNNVRRAANGRRLIGATSRAKVAKTAEEFRHLSKEKAAAAMADIVNLDAGTIRRYLSELFPGSQWKQ